ncbi:MAG: rod shape-determining protein MreD [Lachnospiraceae bacterium]|nr:rod shape-determining protein MreD [Lachnospiraceae bacterium]
MKRYLCVFLLLVVCFLLQTTLFTYLQIAHMVPNLILVVTVASGLMYGRRGGLFAGVISGLLVDLLYGNVIGVGILIYSVVGYLCGTGSKLYFDDDFAVPMVAVAVSDFLYGFMYYVCNFLLRGRLHILFYIRSVILPEMIYTVLVGSVLFYFIRWLDSKVNPPMEVPLKPKKPLEG